VFEDGPESASGEEDSMAAARASVTRSPEGTKFCTLGTDELALDGLSKESTRFRESGVSEVED